MSNWVIRGWVIVRGCCWCNLSVYWSQMEGESHCGHFCILKLVIFKIILQHITWQQFHIYSTKCSNINVGSYRHKNQFFLCLYWIFFIFCRLIQISNLYKYVVQNLFSFMSRGTIGRCPCSNGLKSTYLVFQTHDCGPTLIF